MMNWKSAFAGAIAVIAILVVGAITMIWASSSQAATSYTGRTQAVTARGNTDPAPTYVAVTTTTPVAAPVKAVTTTTPIATTPVTSTTASVAPVVTQQACPTDESMRRTLGFDRLGIKPVFTGEGIAWDPCKWNFQANDLAAVTLTLPSADWQATVTAREDGAVKVFKGPISVEVRGFTLRFLPAYGTLDARWAQDNCELLKREDAFGQRRAPSYPTASGNVQCGTSTSSPGTGNGSITKAWLSANIGGDVQFWTEPTWSGGAWIYKNKGNLVPMKYPGGKLDVWINGPVSITSANADMLNGKTFDEASFTQ